MTDPGSQAIDFDALADNEQFRHGVDLFNRGLPWDAHEAWESLWLIAPRDRPARELLHGLIQLAAAVVKARTAKHDIARRLVDRACAHLALANTTIIDVPALIDAVRTWADDPAQQAPRLVISPS